MDNVIKDPRFSHISSDPKFRRIPKNERKVKIDRRFQSMFKDNRFKVKYTVDKRGRPVNFASKENYKRYYDLSSESDSSEDEAEDEAGSTDNSDDDSLETINNEDIKRKSLEDVPKSKKHKEKIIANEIKKEAEENLSDRPTKVTYQTNKTSSIASTSTSKAIVEKEASPKKSRSKCSMPEFSNTVKPCKATEMSKQNLQRVDKSKGINSNADFEEGFPGLEEENEELTVPETVREKLRDLSVDYARGSGRLLSDSSSEGDSESDEGSEEEVLEHAWGELDRDAERTDEITSRLAVCNMDWDRMRAEDLMVLLSSFLPPGGIIIKVSIYPSEYGLQRMKEEEEKGPQELIEKTLDQATSSKFLSQESDAFRDEEPNSDEEEDAEDQEEGDHYHMERLRLYQLNRLRYFYAVVECDSPATASKLYDECDGHEYESSASHIDLRFVPDDTTFEQTPREVCSTLPEAKKYTPRYFNTTALQQAKVELTWDETDPRRAEISNKLWESATGKGEDPDLKDYLASSSSDNSETEQQNMEDCEDLEEEDAVAKYRALLQVAEEGESGRKGRDPEEAEMQVTWGVSLQAKAEERAKEKKRAAAGLGEATPFQELMEKRRTKLQRKREEREGRFKDKNETEVEKAAFSDDDLPSDVDMDDPFFREELKQRSSENSHKKKIRCKDVDQDLIDKQKAELQLLLMDDSDKTDKQHFSLKTILDSEKTGKGKKRFKKKKKGETEAEVQPEDDFKVNVSDPRFGALYTSHHYNLDPADPHYKQTKAMEALVGEKLRRREEESLDIQPPEKKAKFTSKPKTDPEISTMVKNIKRKTKKMKAK